MRHTDGDVRVGGDDLAAVVDSIIITTIAAVRNAGTAGGEAAAEVLRH